MSHPADYYNKTKNIIFSIYNKDGATAAYKMLDNYRDHLITPSWYGLKAELDFYINNKDRFTLDPVLDFGLKCDFTGNIDGINNCRLDVTTNINFKNLKDYEPIQKKDKRKYKIVIMDKDTGKIAEVFDLNFPLDLSECGRQFEIALFMPSDSDDDGLKYNFYQQIVSIGSSQPDEEFELKTISTDWYLEDFEYYKSMLIESGKPIKLNKEIEEHAIKGASVLSKSTGFNIVACGQRYFKTFNLQTGDGEWVTKIYWKHPVIKDYLDDIIWGDIAHNV